MMFGALTILPLPLGRVDPELLGPRGLLGLLELLGLPGLPGLLGIEPSEFEFESSEGEGENGISLYCS